ncbi:MAG: YbaB/EbfC family nucleoid-associated protein [Pseudomonadota bacterium]
MDPEQLKGLLQQAQTMAQSLQGDLAGKTAEGSAGGGLVRVEVNGSNQVTAVHIDPKVIDPSDPAMLEDLVRAAMNQAFERLRELVAEEMQRRTGGMLPGLF